MSSFTDIEFDTLIVESMAVRLTGWDFSEFSDRWREEEPPWDYKQLVIDRIANVSWFLDGYRWWRVPDLPAAQAGPRVRHRDLSAEHTDCSTYP